MPPRTYHHGDLRRALLDAATALIDEAGPDAVTFRACARRAGVSHTAPAHHVGDLHGLHLALGARYYDEFAAALEAAAATASDPGGRLQAQARAYQAYARAHPQRFALMLRCEPRNETGAEDADLHRARARAAAPLLTVMAELQGRAEADDPSILLAWSCIHGLAGLIAQGVVHAQSPAPGGRADPDAVITLLVRTLTAPKR